MLNYTLCNDWFTNYGRKNGSYSVFIEEKWVRNNSLCVSMFMWVGPMEGSLRIKKQIKTEAIYYQIQLKVFQETSL